MTEVPELPYMAMLPDIAVVAPVSAPSLLGSAAFSLNKTQSGPNRIFYTQT